MAGKLVFLQKMASKTCCVCLENRNDVVRFPCNRCRAPGICVTCLQTMITNTVDISVYCDFEWGFVPCKPVSELQNEKRLMAVRPGVKFLSATECNLVLLHPASIPRHGFTHLKCPHCREQSSLFVQMTFFFGESVHVTLKDEDVRIMLSEDDPTYFPSALFSVKPLYDRLRNFRLGVCCPVELCPHSCMNLASLCTHISLEHPAQRFPCKRCKGVHMTFEEAGGLQHAITHDVAVLCNPHSGYFTHLYDSDLYYKNGFHMAVLSREEQQQSLQAYMRERVRMCDTEVKTQAEDSDAKKRKHDIV